MLLVFVIGILVLALFFLAGMLVGSWLTLGSSYMAKRRPVEVLPPYNHEVDLAIYSDLSPAELDIAGH